MNYADKKSQIQGLVESDLRRKVILPLLKAAGFSNVFEAHGANERGKDIVFRETGLLGDTLYHAGVVTRNDISAAVDDNKNVLRALDQIEQALNEPFIDKYTGKNVSVDRCWLFTSGRILPAAMESVAQRLAKHNLDKTLRFVDGDLLVEFLDHHYPDYWNRGAEIVYYSSYPPIDIASNTLDPPYDQKDALNEAVYDLKKRLDSILSSCEMDLIAGMASVLANNNPRKILNILTTEGRDYFHFRHHTCMGYISLPYGDVSGFVDAYWRLDEAVSEYEEERRIRSTPDAGPCAP